MTCGCTWLAASRPTRSRSWPDARRRQRLSSNQALAGTAVGLPALRATSMPARPTRQANRRRGRHKRCTFPGRCPGRCPGRYSKQPRPHGPALTEPALSARLGIKPASQRARAVTTSRSPTPARSGPAGRRESRRASHQPQFAGRWPVRPPTAPSANRVCIARSSARIPRCALSRRHFS